MERIQELTEKIRLEGVEKGKAEAEEIIAKARAEAAQIVSTAKEQADAIMQQAKKANSELETNTKSELKLYLAQAINALKSEVTNVVTDRIVGSAVADMAADKDFLGQFAVALAKQWTKNEDIVISTPEAETLKAYFAKQAKDLLDKGVTIEKINVWLLSENMGTYSRIINYYVAEGNATYKSLDGILYSADGETSAMKSSGTKLWTTRPIFNPPQPGFFNISPSAL